MHDNIHNQRFSNVNVVSTSRETNIGFLPNPWEDSQRTRPRVYSMQERSFHHPVTSSFPGLDPPMSSPEPDFTPSVSSISSLHSNLRHRHSVDDLRSQSQISPSHHEDYGEPLGQGRLEDHSKVCYYPSHIRHDRAPKYLSLGIKTEESYLFQDQTLSGF